ncbi:MAG: NADH-quinone oxidoreductase subunit NuoF [Bdellovibrionales bacterium]|nr:NADH-quinone oxidoreductase subunit NuoF [Bdellovibrionales bacterium]
MEHKLLTEHYHRKSYSTLEGYKERGGYQTLRHALLKKPQEIVEEVKLSGLRGRGGAGFPTGVKWSFLPNNKEDRYLLCNADEGEPGTFKDRMIMEKAPHQLIEAMLISAYAIQAKKSYIYIRGEYQKAYLLLLKALEEARIEGLIGKNILDSSFSHEMDIYLGAGAYICGEETGMISSLEGKKGQPKLKPPFPAVQGYLGKPTIVNNVETLVAVIPIVKQGAKAYRQIGTERSPGTKIFSLSGDVLNPGNYELPLGYSLMDLIYDLGGGMRAGHSLKAVIPGGSSVPILTAKEAERTRLDYESLNELGTFLGSGGVIVLDDSRDMMDILSIILDFYHHESCGQCTPCREGTGWLSKLLKKVCKGMSSQRDWILIQKIAENMQGRTICALSDAAAMPAISFMKKFRNEFEQCLYENTNSSVKGVKESKHA